VPVELRSPQNSDLTCGFADFSSGYFEQRRAAPGQQRLVSAHAGAAAACQHESRYFDHEKMVASRPGLQTPLDGMANSNKIIQICFIVVCMTLAAIPVDAQQLVVRANRRTGKLVTAVAPEARAKAAAPAVNISEIVEQASRANGVDPLLVRSVIQVESNYNPYAVSLKGAQGLMQLMPATARDLGVGNSFDPRENIEAGVRYLKQLQDLYQNDRLALAAYNAGPGAVKKYGQVPPYPETQAYVKRVGQRYVDARKEAGFAPTATLEPAPAAAAEAPEAAPIVPTEEKHPRLEHYVDEQGRLHLRAALD